jgi:osmoprotectant transport system permease protein
VIGQAGPTWSGPQLAGNWDVIWYYLTLHVQYTVIAVALGALLALPLGYCGYRWPRTYPPLLTLANLVYAIPSITMFVLLFPFLGITNDKPIVVAMALYTLVILVRSLVEGLRSVPPATVAAATGMGYGALRRFFAVELPLALPNLIAGLRLATVSTVSLISVGGLIGRGALGRLFNDGFTRDIPVEVRSAIVAIVALALVADLALLLLGRVLTPWTRARATR